jgi:putative DNA primase/helicase
MSRKKAVETLIDSEVVQRTTEEFSKPNVVNAAFWMKGLIRNKEGNSKRCLANVMHVLELHPDWAGVLAYDAFAESVITTKAPPMREQDRPTDYVCGDFTETDGARAAAWFQHEIGIDATPDLIFQAVVAVAEKHKVHPVRDYLRRLQHDATPRVDGMLPTYFGAPDSAYNRAIGARFMIGAVARVMRPGCKVDTMLVLEGKQGIGKSTGAKILAVDWFADTGVTVGEKDSYQALRRVWLYEFGELAGVRANAIEKVKNFLSSSVDHYRPSYGRQYRDFPRQTVFIATTNEENYLVDRTGNRRFWPVRCGEIDAKALRRDRDQLWAEAVARFDAGEKWHVDSLELAKLCEAEQAERQAPDDWTPIVEEWLECPTVPDPQSGGREVIRRRLFLENGITTHEVLLGGIGMKPADMNTAATTRIGKVLHDLKFERGKQRRENGERVRRYYRVTTVTAHDEAGGDGSGDTDEASTQPDSSLSPLSPPNDHVHARGGGE